MKELKKDLKTGMSEDENYSLEKKVWPYRSLPLTRAYYILTASNLARLFQKHE